MLHQLFDSPACCCSIVQLEFHRAYPCALSCEAPNFQDLLFGPGGVFRLMKMATSCALGNYAEPGVLVGTCFIEAVPSLLFWCQFFCGCLLIFSDSCRTGKSREFLSYPMQLIRKHSSLCRLVGNVSRLFSDVNREQTLQTK